MDKDLQIRNEDEEAISVRGAVETPSVNPEVN